MPNILEIISQRAKAEASRIAKKYQVDNAFGELGNAKQFDDHQKSAILNIADTEGFKVIVEYEWSIMGKCLEILKDAKLTDEYRKEAQREYAISSAKYSFLTNLADPNK